MKSSKVLVFLVILLIGWIGFSQVFPRFENRQAQKAVLLHSISGGIIRLEALKYKTENNDSAIYRLTSDLGELISQYFILEGAESTTRDNNVIIIMDDQAVSFYLHQAKTIVQKIQEATSGSGNTVRELNQSIERLKKYIGNIEELQKSELQSIQLYKTIAWIVFMSISICFLLILAWNFYHFLYLPLRKLEEYTKDLSIGQLNGKCSKVGGGMFSKLFNNLMLIGERINQAGEFITEIEKGNFSNTLTAQNDDDLLAKSLISLKNKLIKVGEEDQRRHWANEGLNKFNELIRANQEDESSLAQEIINELVKYASVNQGAIFRLTKEDKDKLELIAAYAWGRKKFINKSIDIHESVIGQAILEKQYVQINDVPENYVEITSGLGKSTPRSIIILPLIYNEACYGAIELASFQLCDNDTMNFLLKLTENIAAAFFTITNNSETKKLLLASQQQAEQLKIQEEELRQNEEELQAAQENLSRKLEEATQEMKNQLKKVEAEKLKNLAILEGNEDAVIMFRENGAIEFINSSAGELFGIDKERIIGKQIESLIPVKVIHQGGGAQVFFTGNGSLIPISLRTEITMEDTKGEELSLLITASNGKVEDETTFAFFIQRISVELF